MRVNKSIACIHQAVNMSEDLIQYLVGIPSLVSRLENYYNTEDLNQAEYLLMRIDEYCRLLRVLSGEHITMEILL